MSFGPLPVRIRSFRRWLAAAIAATYPNVINGWQLRLGLLLSVVILEQKKRSRTHSPPSPLSIQVPKIDTKQDCFPNAISLQGPPFEIFLVKEIVLSSPLGPLHGLNWNKIPWQAYMPYASLLVAVWSKNGVFLQLRHPDGGSRVRRLEDRVIEGSSHFCGVSTELCRQTLKGRLVRKTDLCFSSPQVKDGVKEDAKMLPKARSGRSPVSQPFRIVDFDVRLGRRDCRSQWAVDLRRLMLYQDLVHVAFRFT